MFEKYTARHCVIGGSLLTMWNVNLSSVTLCPYCDNSSLLTMWNVNRFNFERKFLNAVGSLLTMWNVNEVKKREEHSSLCVLY